MILAVAKIEAACQDYGHVSLLGRPNPAKCSIIAKDIEAAAEKRYSALIQVINYKDKPCDEAVDTILECEAVSDITDTRVMCHVERTAESQYEISFQPSVKGKHQIHIKVEGQHIRGSPFSVTVKGGLMELPILTIGAMETPWGVAIGRTGEVVVTERSRDCISVFHPNGKRIQSFGSRGDYPGQLICPCGLAIDLEGNILVADSDNHRIQKFTADGHFISAVGTKSPGPLQFYNPLGVAFNAFNRKVYVVDRSHQVKVLNSDLTLFSTFGREGSSKGQLHTPHSLACDDAGNVYVADSGNHRIQVFTSDGKFLRTFGKDGEGSGELYWPIGVAVDTSNKRVYVSEGENHRISVFSIDGQFVRSFGRKGVGDGKLKCPRGISVGAAGELYVCDFYNHRVQIF